MWVNIPYMDPMDIKHWIGRISLGLEYPLNMGWIYFPIHLFELVDLNYQTFHIQFTLGENELSNQQFFELPGWWDHKTPRFM